MVLPFPVAIQNFLDCFYLLQPFAAYHAALEVGSGDLGASVGPHFEEPASRGHAASGSTQRAGHDR